MPEVFTISQLERESGLSRSTIHFYIRQGLLPPAHKTAVSRSLYSEDHLMLLRSIGVLKGAGQSLADIREALSDDRERAEQRGEGLALRKSERIRRRILRVATEEFATNGYEKTHVSTIIRKLGITNQVFYSHFPSKLELLVESFHTFLDWNVAFYEARVAGSSDLGERVLWRLSADKGVSHFASEVMSHIHAERGHSTAERRRLAERAWEGVVQVATKELESLSEGGPRPSVPLELLSHSLIGAHHNAAMRASWDDQWTPEDVLRTHLWIWLAVQEAISGAAEIDSQLGRYEDLIRHIVSHRPEAPPAIEE